MTEKKSIILSSGKKNDKGFVTPIKNIDFSEFLEFPMMYYDHREDLLPIGIWENLVYNEDGLPEMTPVFHKKTELSISCADMYYSEKGFLRACSIGGMVRLNVTMDTAEHFLVNEISIVPIPSDRGAIKSKFLLSHSLKDDEICNKKAEAWRLSSKLENKEDYFYFRLNSNGYYEEPVAENTFEKNSMAENTFLEKIETAITLGFEKVMKIIKPETNQETYQETTLKTEDNMENEKKDNPSEIEDEKMSNQVMSSENDGEKNIVAEQKDDDDDGKDDDYKDENEELLSGKEYCLKMGFETKSKSHEKTKLSSKEWEIIYNKSEKKTKEENLTSKWHQEKKDMEDIKKIGLNGSLNNDKTDYEGYEKQVLNATKSYYDSKVVDFSENIYKILNRDGVDSVKNTILNGTTSQKLNLHQSIKNTDKGRVFYSVAKFGERFENGSQTESVSEDVYIKNLDDFGRNAREMYSKSNLNKEMKLSSNGFMADPALDAFTFSDLAYITMFPNNNWRTNMTVVPVRFVGNGIGFVYANININPPITVSQAQSNSTSPVVQSTTYAYTDKPMAMQMYEFNVQPTNFRRYNADYVAYAQIPRQMENIFKSMEKTMSDWQLYFLGSAINTLGGVAGTTKQGTSGSVTAVDANWPLVPNPTPSSYKQISYDDIVKIQQKLIKQNLEPSETNTMLCVDAFMYGGVATDEKINNFLTRFTKGDSIERLKVLDLSVVKRGYYLRYDTATNQILDPSVDTTADTIQIGMALSPEFNLIGISDFEVYSMVDPRTYGTVMSAQIRSGANVAYGADSQFPAMGNFLIIPQA